MNSKLLARTGQYFGAAVVMTGIALAALPSANATYDEAGFGQCTKMGGTFDTCCTENGGTISIRPSGNHVCVFLDPIQTAETAPSGSTPPRSPKQFPKVDVQDLARSQANSGVE